jgi:elongation factor G
VVEEHYPEFLAALAAQGRACFREAHQASKSKLLEPIMRIEVVTENTYLGDIIGHVNRRRGQVTDQGHKGMQATVQGLVPLAEMFGYINFRRSTTSGRGTFSLEFAHYAEVPAGLPRALPGRGRPRIEPNLRALSLGTMNAAKIGR